MVVLAHCSIPILLTDLGLFPAAAMEIACVCIRTCMKKDVYLERLLYNVINKGVYYVQAC